MTLSKIVNYYESTKVEESRLKLDIFQLEYERTSNSRANNFIIDYK